MNKVAPGRTVRMEYELTLADGTVIESSASRGPLEYVHGSGKMLPGLEKRIEGLGAGEEGSGIVPAAEAYGADDSTLPALEIPREEFPEGEELQVGKQFTATDSNGQPVTFKVVQFDDETVNVRLTHPLAGRDIHYKIKIIDVSDAP